ncbi:MAG: TrkA family potassium uptake protein [Paracoccaceae bacterium]|jgi:trk system potassium uptake protein TrkA|nr:TrkA family potassium uptake protein [Paracoccaceae bacterium]
MRIVIVGASRFGTATAAHLTEAGHEVIVVDRDADKLQALSDEVDAGLLEGDGSLPSVLRDAYGDGADALVLLTNVDDVNILAALVGRSVGYPRVVPQIVRKELLAVCAELGLENLITPHATVARSIARTLESHHDATLDLRSHQGFDVLGYRVGAQHDGARLADIDLPKATRAIAVARGEGDELLTEETRLRKGDLLIVAVAAEAQERMDELFPSDAD